MYCLRKVFSVTPINTLTVITMICPKCSVVLAEAAFPLAADFLRSVFLYQFRGDRLSGESR